MVDITSEVSSDESPLYYTVYLELGQEGQRSSETDELEWLQALATDIDKYIGESNEIYGVDRAAGVLGPLAVCCVRPGTFSDFATHFVSAAGTDPSQFKLPRCISNETMRKHIRGAVVQQARTAQSFK